MIVIATGVVRAGRSGRRTEDMASEGKTKTYGLEDKDRQRQNTETYR